MRQRRIATAIIAALTTQAAGATFALHAAAQTDAEEGPEQAPAEEMPPEEAPEDTGEGEEDVPSDAEIEAEMEAELAKEEARAAAGITAPPPKGKGVIFGTITDTEFREGLIEVSVTVLGTKYKALTDLNGRFRLELPPGTYSIRAYYELHLPARIDGLVVAEGQLVRADIELAPDESSVDVVEVVSEANKASLEGMLLARQRATAVGDSIGRTEIAKTPDRNAAQAAQRVVGATIVGNRFVYVRGLGERYSNALVNGVPLPSPEPDRAAVPLDLFPTGVLNSLTIVKTFTPDMPGDFAGGSVRVETREIPSEPFFQLSLSGGLNSQASFQDRLTYPGGGLDWLGIDDGARELPSGVPNWRQQGGFDKPDGSPVTQEDLVESGRALNRRMSIGSASTPPEHGVTVVGGSSWNLGGDQKFGTVASLNYSRSYTVRENEIRREFTGDVTDDRGFSVVRDYRVTTGSDNVSWGGFASFTYRPSRQHNLSLIGIRTTLSENFAQVYTGRHAYRNIDIYATKAAFISRALNFGVLRGEHVFDDFNEARLDWFLTLSRATRQQPDMRDVVWAKGLSAAEDANYRYHEAPDSGRHFYSDQAEDQYGGGLDWTQPLRKGAKESALKWGGLMSIRKRGFEARNLRYRREARATDPLLNCESRDFAACTDRLFQDENIDSIIALEEATQPEDAYDAELNVYAGYLMADLRPWERWRVVAGQRVEYTHQVIDPYDQFGLARPPDGASIKQADLLPALSVVWNLVPKANLRAAVTRTLARPQLRELAPFTFADFFGGRLVGGNADLELTKIVNADLRMEYFPTLREVLAMSVFFKSFDDPIEPVLIAGGELGTLTFQNAEGATLLGLELEARKSLDFLSPSLKAFSVVTNLTLAQSQIDLAEGTSVSFSSKSRPLVNQAPYVFNFSIDYSDDELGTSARVLYNVTGPRIVEVGSASLPDVYEHPRGIVDLTLQQRLLKALSLRLALRNLLNAPVVVTQGCGNEGLFGSTWHLSCKESDDVVVRRYTEGISGTLTASYDF
jgi:hypothetical protein